jgi:hypothetical protein
MLIEISEKEKTQLNRYTQGRERGKEKKKLT